MDGLFATRISVHSVIALFLVCIFSYIDPIVPIDMLRFSFCFDAPETKAGPYHDTHTEIHYRTQGEIGYVVRPPESIDVELAGILTFMSNQPLRGTSRPEAPPPCIGWPKTNETVTATRRYYVVGERGCRMSVPVPLDPALVGELMVEFGCVRVRPRVGIKYNGDMETPTRMWAGRCDCN